MARRRRPEQLTLPRCDLDPGLDAVLGGSALVSIHAPLAPTPSETRERAGRTAQRHGDAWEDRFAAMLKAAKAAARLAWFLKVETPLGQRRVPRDRGGWEWQLFRKAKAAADFNGFNARGHTVAIECKSTEERRLARSAIRPPQAEQLDALAATTDGVPLLAVQFRHVGRDAWGAREYLVPYRRAPWTVALSAEGLDEADLADWRLIGGALFERLQGR